MNLDLHGRVAVVTGGTGSIGSVLCSYLTSQGANVIAVSRTRAKEFSCDVSKEEQVIGLMRKIDETYGKIDILILASGTQLRKPFVEFSSREFREIIDSHLMGAFNCCVHAIPLIKKAQNGRIIGITSLSTQIGIRQISAYAAAKGGMMSLLRCLAVELADQGITVNAIAPGRVSTNMTSDLANQKETYQANISRIPLGRWGTPNDLIPALAMLCSEQSSYMTGQEIVVDGGWLASGGNL